MRRHTGLGSCGVGLEPHHVLRAVGRLLLPQDTGSVHGAEGLDVVSVLGEGCCTQRLECSSFFG